MPYALEILRNYLKSEVYGRVSELQVTKDGNPFSEGSNNDFGLIASRFNGEHIYQHAGFNELLMKRRSRGEGEGKVSWQRWAIAREDEGGINDVPPNMSIPASEIFRPVRESSRLYL